VVSRTSFPPAKLAVRLARYGDSVLDDGDTFVASNGTDTIIDLGAAAGASVTGLNVVTVAGVTGLAEAYFLFA
jgi:hypothetical protein